jgi:hypothetical protein
MKEKNKLDLLEWLDHPKNLAKQPFEVVSPQNPCDHESLSVS